MKTDEVEAAHVHATKVCARHKGLNGREFREFEDIDRLIEEQTMGCVTVTGQSAPVGLNGHEVVNRLSQKGHTISCVRVGVAPHVAVYRRRSYWKRPLTGACEVRTNLPSAGRIDRIGINHAM
jgi:hypothetical protein